MSEKRKIGRLYDKEKNNQEFDPYTSFDAVLDSDGNTLTKVLKTKLDKLNFGAGLLNNKDTVISTVIVELTEEEYQNLEIKESNIIYSIKNSDVTDLGLPSGTLWANKNIGATNKEDYGYYFASGETIGYNDETHYFDWDHYLLCNGSGTTLTKYCSNSNYGTVDGKTIIECEDDAAYANWGKGWSLPTKTQMDELRDNCTWKWTTINDINGYLVTGPNKNTIFLPAGGYRDEIFGELSGERGYYWSNTVISSGLGTYAFELSSYGVGTEYLSRCLGRNIRPVYFKKLYFYINGIRYDSIDELKNYLEVTSVTSLVPSKLIKAIISLDQTFGLVRIPEAGLETHVIIKNEGSSNITITLPTEDRYINCGDTTLMIAPNTYGEINAISDGTNIYLRVV